MTNQLVRGVMLSVAGALAFVGTAQAGVSEVEAVLQTYVADYVADPTFLQDATFGIRVDQDWWTVTATPGDVAMTRGEPTTPTYYFEIYDESTLHRINRGELNAQTAMVQEFSTDPVPMTIEVQDGYQPDQSFVQTVLPLSFHFFTRGIPEIVPFGAELSRETHGGHSVIFFYEEGLRSGWGFLAPGDHANEHELSKSNPFPSMFIISGGRGMALLDGREMVVEEGQMIFIPRGMTHEFWNPFDENMEFFLVMFGEDA